MRDFPLTRRCFLGSLALAAAARGQEPDVTFSTAVDVVSLLANIRNRRGELVRDLTKDDFALLENGHPQTIRYFTRESDLLLTIGLMIDTSGSQEHVLNAERGAALRFLDQVLRENKDHVFIQQFDRVIRTRAVLTSSRAKLDAALAFVDTQTRRELMTQGGGTLLYDAVAQASEEIMKPQQGRKALICLTDGVDYGSDKTLDEAIDSAHRGGTLVYSVLFADAFDRNGAAVLKRLALETGGGYFEVTKKLTIDQVFAIIEEDLRNQYSVGYVSDRPAEFPEFRRIALSVKRPGVTVQARNRYWAQPAH